MSPPGRQGPRRGPSGPQGEFRSAQHDGSPVSATLQRPVASPWTPALAALGLLIGALLIIYRETALAMVAIWSRSDTFAHAFLVPPIVAWLIWRKRDALAAEVPRASAWVLAPIALAGVIWLLGELAVVNALTQLAFTALLVLVVVALLGPRASRVIAFPLAFLFFAVPIGEFVLPYMMDATANFTVFALRLSGIPVYREGLQFIIPSGNWSVVEACSGIRYLMASVMVGVLFAYLNYASLRRRLIFVAVSIAVPVVANWLRAYFIVLLGHLSSNRLATGTDHLVYGWVFFGVVITLMFVIGARWSESNPPDGSATLSKWRKVEALPMRAPWALAVGAAVLLVVPHLALWTIAKNERSGEPALAAPQRLASGWTVSAEPADFKPAFKGAAAEFNQVYASAGRQVGLYVGYYRHQDYAQKLITSDNAVVTHHDAEWSSIQSGRRRIELARESLTFNTDYLRNSNHVAAATTHRIAVWQIYWIDGTLTANEEWAKGITALHRLVGRGDDAAVLVLSADDDGRGAGDAALETFVRDNLSLLTRQLADTRNSAAASTARASRPLAAP